jgi:hypothetical protein
LTPSSLFKIQQFTVCDSTGFALTSPPFMPDSTRADGRAANQLRPLRFQNHIAPYADRLDAHRMGQHARHLRRDRRGIRAALDEGAKSFRRLAHRRILDAPLLHFGTQTARHLQRKIDGRSSEIQRLIGRSIRAAIDLEKVGARTICVDCDVLAGRWRNANRRITGAFVALSLAVKKLIREKNRGKSNFKIRRRRECRNCGRPAAFGFVLHRRRRRGGGHESRDEFRRRIHRSFKAAARKRRSPKNNSPICLRSARLEFRNCSLRKKRRSHNFCHVIR